MNNNIFMILIDSLERNNISANTFIAVGVGAGLVLSGLVCYLLLNKQNTKKHYQSADAFYTNISIYLMQNRDAPTVLRDFDKNIIKSQREDNIIPNMYHFEQYVGTLTSADQLNELANTMKQIKGKLPRAIRNIAFQAINRQMKIVEQTNMKQKHR